MAEKCFDTTADRLLSSSFEEAFELHNKIINSIASNTDNNFQEDISRGIDLLEEITNKVSELCIFSSNESLDEVATSNLKYLLLPALLGDLTLRKLLDDRMQILEVAEVYYKDFLRRCCDYGVVEKDEEKEESPQPVTAAAKRQMKIDRYKEQKTLDDRIKIMKDLLAKDRLDEEMQRKYYLSVLKKFVYIAEEELESIKSEIPLLLHMAQMKVNPKNSEPQPPQKKLKPVIITKDKFQKQVFGVGYPSIPSMTIEEWAEQQIAQGALATAGATIAQNPSDNVEEDERARAQAMDEFKDEHRRGEGNRYNRS